jgi:CubicO group peptidase (beta-lactamase class C family)
MKALAAIISAVCLLTGCASGAADIAEPASGGLLPGCSEAVAYSNGRRGLSVLVLQNGITVCSSGGKSIETPYELWSGTKSFVGVMAAAAVQDGLLRLDEPASETLTEWAGDPVKSAVTLRHILWMVEGQPSEIGNPPGYAGAVEVPFNAAPGERFQYGPVPMQLFGEVMRRKLRSAGLEEDPLAYLERRILRPLGIAGYRWRDGSDGYPLMPQGAIFSARDWALFGEFVLRGGRAADGTLLVSAVAFSEMFEGSAVNPAYGLTWWLARPSASPDPVTQGSDLRRNLEYLPADLVMASGAGGQRLYLIPSRGLVIVRQAELDLDALRAGAGPEWRDTEFLNHLLGVDPPAPAIADTLTDARAPDGRYISWREHLIDAEDVNGGVRIRGGDGLAMADLDGDGKGDIVSVHEDSGHIRVAFAGSGPQDWQLATLAQGPAASAVEDIAVGDLNGDGWPDLIAACEEGHLIYLENPGPEARSAPWASLIPDITKGRGSWLRVFLADMNGDGRLDVTAANKGAADIIAPGEASRIASTTSLLLLDGPPLEQASWREQVLLREGIANTAQPVDIDGDGDFDLLAAARNRQEMFLLETLGPRPDGTLDIAVHGVSIAPPAGAADGWRGRANAFQSDWADIDGDGRTDLLVNVVETAPGQPAQLGLAWLLQPDTLEQPWTFHRIGDVLPDWVAGLKFADIDGDGYPDVMAGGYSGLNILSGTYSGAPRMTDDPGATASDTLGRIAWFRNLGPGGDAWTRYDISRRVRGMYDGWVAADLDGDGDLDFVSTRGNSGAFDGVFWIEQVRSAEPPAAFTAARAQDSRQMAQPPQDWRSRYRSGQTYTPSVNTD